MVHRGEVRGNGGVSGKGPEVGKEGAGLTELHGEEGTMLRPQRGEKGTMNRAPTRGRRRLGGEKTGRMRRDVKGLNIPGQERGSEDHVRTE